MLVDVQVVTDPEVVLGDNWFGCLKAGVVGSDTLMMGGGSLLGELTVDWCILVGVWTMDGQCVTGRSVEAMKNLVEQQVAVDVAICQVMIVFGGR